MIVITLLWFIWHQTDFRLVSNQSEKCNHTQNLVRFNNIQKIFPQAHKWFPARLELLLSAIREADSCLSVLTRYARGTILPRCNEGIQGCSEVRPHDAERHQLLGSFPGCKRCRNSERYSREKSRSSIKKNCTNIP